MPKIIASCFLLISLLLIVQALDPFIGRPVETLSVLGLDTVSVDFPYMEDNLSMLPLYQSKDPFGREIRRLISKGSQGQRSIDEDKLLARMYFYRGQMVESEQIFSDLLEKFPNDRDLLKGFGLLRMRQGELQNCDGRKVSCIYPRVQKHGNAGFAKAGLRLFERAQAISSSVDMEWVMRIARLTASEAVVPVADNISNVGLLTRLPVLTGAVEGPEVTGLGLTRGVITGDFNGDGRLDIVTANTSGPMGFFVNLGGRKFKDQSVQSGLGKITDAFIVMPGDIDNDGDLDLYVSRNAFYGQLGNLMLRNDGRGRFEDVTQFSGTGNAGASFVSAFSDYDLDGDLDLFVANLSSPMPFAGGVIADIYGHRSNTLYRNRGNGRFDDVTREAGLFSINSHLGAAWGDIDEDGDPDLYVTTYFGPNRLYLNKGDGTFMDVSKSTGVREPWASFSGWFFDYDSDTHLDLLVTAHAPTKVVAAYNLDGTIPKLARVMRLYKGNGKGDFSDVTEMAGLRVAAAAMGANWGDINRDGFPDFYLGTGGPPLERLEPNLIFINQGDGTFFNATEATSTGVLQKGHGISFADLDGDGWQDLYAGFGGAWPVDAWSNSLYWNDSGLQPRKTNLIRVILKGRQANSHGVGARITLSTRKHKLMREISPGGGFGVNPYTAEFATGARSHVESLEVRWPGGFHNQVFRNLPSHATIIIDENNNKPLILSHRVNGPMFDGPTAALSDQFRAAP